MTRYYFDVSEGDGFTIDREGLEFSNYQDAWAEAARSAGEMMSDKINTSRRFQRVTLINVRDSVGLILSVSLSLESKVTVSPKPS